MRRRIDWSSLLILSLGLLFSLGGASSSFGQTQPCPGCLSPSSGTPTYNPGIPSYPGSSSSMGPQTSTSGWTVPVPDRVSISQSGQVYFHYNNYAPIPGTSGVVPVSGINPYNTFNGMNGMPHWSSIGGNLAGMISTYYGSPSNYSPASTYSPFGSPHAPIPVASVYNPSTGTQVGATNINGLTNSLNNLGATSLTYRNPTSPTYTPSTSFTTSSFSSNYVNNYNQTNYSQQTSSSATQVEQALRNSGLNSTTTNLFGQARNLADSGRELFSAGQLQKALEAYNRALPISQAAGDKVVQAVTLASIAQTYLAMGEGRQALEHFNQAFQVSREANNLKLQTLAMRGIGAAHLASGETELALDAYRRARILAAGDVATEAEILASMGWVYQSSGELQQALAHYQEALALVVKSGNLEAELKTRVGIGLLHHSLGESNKSLDQYRAAMKIAKTDAEVAGILISAGDVYQSNGMTNKALACYNKARSLMKESGNKTGEAGTLISIARMYMSQSFAQTALEYYTDALKLMREEGNRAGEAGALAGIGEVYFWAGLRGYPLAKQAAASPQEKVPGKSEPFITIKGATRPYGFGSSDFPKAMKQALKYYEEALVVMTSMGNQVGEVGILTNIGLTYDSWDKPKEALASYHKAINGLESLRAAARLEEFRTSLAQQSAIVYQRAILLHLRLGQQAEAFELSERARARTFLDQMGNSRLDIRKGADAQAISQEQALRQRLAALEKQLAQELAQPAQLNKEAIQALETRLIAGRREYEDLLTRLKASNPEYASLISVETLKLAEAQSLLSPDTTLVSYFVTPEMTLAFVLTRDSFHVSKLPVKQWELQAAITDFRDFSSLSEATPTSLKQLHKWLIAPLKSHLKTPLVGIVPHGVLHNLPFAALTDGKRYLADNYTIFHLPSVSALPFIQRRQMQMRENGRMLALAYGQGEGQPFLRYAEEEAQTVARLYQTQALTGSAATKAALRASAGESGILHLVAHYQPNSVNPLFSQLLLAPGEKTGGSLELHEVYGLDLQRTNLVVLSACQTQLGAQSRGDDISGLNRVFMYAGAPTVVASLWSVDDKATVELMTSFYTHLKGGMSKATALRTAQAETRAKYSHPYYWAGFVLAGHPGITTAPSSGHAIEAFDTAETGRFKN